MIVGHVEGRKNFTETIGLIAELNEKGGQEAAGIQLGGILMTKIKKGNDC